MNREYGDFIEDIIDSIDKVEEFTENMNFQDFSKDEKTGFAVIRAMEIIGEAVKNIPDSIRGKYKGIPWKDIAGMRDKLIHGYFGVNLEVIWKTVEDQLPGLKKKLLKVLEDLKK